MDTRYMNTGDETADQVLALIAAHSRAVPPHEKQVVLDGRRPLDFKYRYLASKLEISVDRCVEAIAYLATRRLIRFDDFLRPLDGSAPAGVRVWINAQIEDRAA